MSKEIPLSVQIGELERELKMRESVYPGQVEAKKLKQHIADRQLNILRECIRTLKELRATELTSARETTDPGR